MVIAERACLMAADAVVIVVTVNHTYGIIKASRVANIQATFSRVILSAGWNIAIFRDAQHTDADGF